MSNCLIQVFCIEKGKEIGGQDIPKLNIDCFLLHCEQQPTLIEMFIKSTGDFH